MPEQEEDTKEPEKEPETEAVSEEAAVEEQEHIEDDLADRVANKVYDKIKSFVTDLTTAAEDVNQLVSESIASKADEITPPEDAAAEAEAVGEDVKPKRSHKLFARPGKRE